MKKINFKITLLLLFPFTFLLKYFFSNSPYFTETFYSLKFNKVTIQLLSKITGIFSFSLSEFTIYIIILMFFCYITYTVIKLFKNNKKIKKIVIDFMVNCAIVISVLYFIFIILWGLNYNRVPFGQTMKTKTEKYTVEDLAMLYEYIVNKSNSIREQIEEDSNGVMKVSGEYRSVFQRAQKGYDNASSLFPTLRGQYGMPKPIFISELLNYAGITGIYSPLTGEPNINIKILDILLPATTTHEMAHQRGYANEDEANFIAYITCIMHPDIDFQYSGYMLALTYVNNALDEEDSNLLKELNGKLSIKVKRDLIYNNIFWKKYEGKIDAFFSKMNDNYLKANGVEDGEKSYSRMVDLLLHYYTHYISNNY